MQVKIPFLSEGVDSGIIVSILVREGEPVKKEQTLLELETNKATAPIPAPKAGVVSRIHVKEGDEVSVGQVIVTLSEPETSKNVSKRHSEARSDEESRTEILHSAQDDTAMQTSKSISGIPIPASPSVRKMARELGIDLTQIHGTEKGGRITLSDIRSFLKRLSETKSSERPKSVPPAIDFSKWGPITRKPVSSIRRTIGQKMQESWTNIPHVTQFDEADISVILALKKRYAPDYERRGMQLTLTVLLLKAVVGVLKTHPIFNSSLDESKNELVYKSYFNLGIAVDTKYGLMVPVIRNVDKKSLLELSTEMGQLAEKTRGRKLSLEETQGGTFTISNLGGIGGSHFTPIVYPPQVAILGIGRSALRPVIQKGKVLPRTILPLCVSYDHRVIDGADGARFMQDLVDTLEHFRESQLALPKGNPTGNKKRKRK